MKFSIDDIKKYFDQRSIGFSIKGEANEVNAKTFQLASIHNKIKNGIYFIDSKNPDVASDIRNSIIITDQEVEAGQDNFYFITKNPQLAHYLLAGTLEFQASPSIHPTSIVHPEAEIAASVHIGPFCVIGKVKIEDHAALYGHITVNDNTFIGKNTVIESHTVIGARGMAWIWDDEGNRIMQPQLGGVIIEENCLIGTGIAIVRGSLSENTIIGSGTVMAHGSKVGHGCVVGKEVHFANNVSLAGNARIGDRVFLGSGCVVSSNVTVAEGCIVGAGAVVHKSVDEAYCTLAGVPATIIKRNNFEFKPKGAPKPFNKNK